MQKSCRAVLWGMVLLVPTGLYSEPSLLLSSGFEPSTAIPTDISDLSGTDNTTGFSWDNAPAWIHNSNFVYIVSDGKDPHDFMNSEIVDMIGPHGTMSKVLHMQNKGDDPDHSSTSRNEYSLFANDPPNQYTEGYVRYYMKLQDDLDEIIPEGAAAGWYMIMEWKEPNSGTAYSSSECSDQGCTAGGSNNYRINIGIDKDRDSTGLHWILNGQAPQPCRCTEWTVRNRDVPVPLGDWFLVEAYMKKHPTDGRVYFAVNGEVVCDTVCRTEHADNPLPLKFWSIFKLYHGSDWLAAGPTNQWYDDLELWSGFPRSRGNEDVASVAEKTERISAEWDRHRVHLEFEWSGTRTISVHDALGNLFAEKTVYAQSAVMHLPETVQGVYFVKVRSAFGHETILRGVVRDE